MVFISGFVPLHVLNVFSNTLTVEIVVVTTIDTLDGCTLLSIFRLGFILILFVYASFVFLQLKYRLNDRIAFFLQPLPVNY